MENNPDLWLDHFPKRQGYSHKYDYGHALIYGAPVLTGATRLAAEACARIGAGLTTVISEPNRADIYRVSLPAHIMVRDDMLWDDKRVTAKLYGPGGLSVKPDLQANLPVVLDADALGNLKMPLTENCILTPHEGEFARLFPHYHEGPNVERARAAAKASNAIVVLKGAETVIAHPDGCHMINTHATAYLATAGSGDVLSGMITGLTAQGMAPFEAACAAVWIHGDCAIRFGAGLVASDLINLIPEVLQDLT